MRAAAELEAVGAGAHHAHAVTVLVAEEGDRPHGLGVLLRRLDRVDLFVGDDVGVDQRQDLGRLLRRHAGAVGEVEAQSVRSHEGTLLTYVVTEDRAQSRVQEVGRGVIASRRLAPFGVDRGDGHLAGQQLAGEEPAMREEPAGDVLDVEDLEAARSR